LLRKSIGPDLIVSNCNSTSYLRRLFQQHRPNAGNSQDEIPHCSKPDLILIDGVCCIGPWLELYMRFDRLKWRDFMTLFGGAAVWPVAARAQQAGKLPTVGFLGSSTPEAIGPRVAAFVQRLRELGWIEGRTIAIEYRWGEGREDRFAEVAAEFVRLKVDVIVTSSTPAVMAAKHATTVIPIVFANSADPVGSSLVASLARPGGNVTGVSNQGPELAGKRLAILREAVPGLRRVAVMGNANIPFALQEVHDVKAAAGALGLECVNFEIRQVQDIAPAFDALRPRADGLYLVSDLLTNANRLRINLLALGARLPTIHGNREYALDGGLISYGANLPGLYRRSAEYVDKILRGAKPADIPVEQPTKFDLIINLIVAKALGLTIPEPLLLRADEVIE
jgi:putative ABC transport system substrate-binding protein